MAFLCLYYLRLCSFPVKVEYCPSDNWKPGLTRAQTRSSQRISSASQWLAFCRRAVLPVRRWLHVHPHRDRTTERRPHNRTERVGPMAVVARSDVRETPRRDTRIRSRRDLGGQAGPCSPKPRETDIAYRVPRPQQFTADLLDRLAIDEMRAPVLRYRLHD